MAESFIYRAHFAAVASDLLSTGAGDASSILEAERAVLGLPQLLAAKPRARPTNWILRLHAYERFFAEEGRTPRETIRQRDLFPSTERHLGEWAGYQRRQEEDLHHVQRIRLDVSPAFVWDPYDSIWNDRLSECERHQVEFDRLPYLNSSDDAEFALARWLARQLRQLQLGTLTKERAERLLAFLAGDKRRLSQNRGI